MEHLGKIAYDAYRLYSNGRSLVTGVDIPDYEDLPAPVRAGWQLAGIAVYHHVVERDTASQPWTAEQRDAYRAECQRREQAQERGK